MYPYTISSQNIVPMKAVTQGQGVSIILARVGFIVVLVLLDLTGLAKVDVLVCCTFVDMDPF